MNCTVDSTGRRSARHRSDGVTEILLPGGKIALIDSADWPLVSGYPWTYYPNRHPHCYVIAYCRNGSDRSRTLMHRLILGAERGAFVDHRDGDGLNNRRSNIRLATGADNARNLRSKPRDNTSGFKGVIRNTSGNWGARIGLNGDRLHLGTFHSRLEAAKAYNYAALLLHGDFASLNPLPEEEL